MNQYTVIGYYEENGQTFSHHVDATSPQNAFFKVAQEHSSACLIATLDGHLEEGKDITFAGESVVDAETILSQPDVFDADQEQE